MANTKKKLVAKPTIDTCVVSKKPIKQNHIDGKKVINYGKGRAFISAIKKSVSKPSPNPVVITGSDLEELTVRFETWSFPYRVKILGKQYSTFPSKIYLHNAEFRLGPSGVDFNWLYAGELEETEDQCINTGIVTYIKKLPPPVDKPDEK